MTNWENSKNIFSQNGISAHDNVPKDVLNWIIENGWKAKNEKNTYSWNLTTSTQYTCTRKYRKQYIT